MSDVSFQLKGSVITVVVLELRRYDPATFPAELQAKVDAAPQFFVNSPVLISLEKLENPEALTAVAPLLDSCRQQGLLPVGLAAVPNPLRERVAETGLALLPPPGERASKMPAESAPSSPPAEAPQPAARASRVITRPIRSGQQVYAEGADLIVLSQVSEGAEVLADGHIHVYGALRGRALAGVRGDTQARVFCQSLEAELVSIAGTFLLQDSFDQSLIKKAAQIRLSDESLCMDAL